MRIISQKRHCRHLEHHLLHHSRHVIAAERAFSYYNPNFAYSPSGNPFCMVARRVKVHKNLERLHLIHRRHKIPDSA